MQLPSITAKDKEDLLFAKEMDLDALRGAVGALPGVGMGQLEQAKTLGDRALSHSVHPEVHARLFGARAGQHLYAYQTFLTACGDADKGDPGKPATILDCPIHVDTDLFVWLELGRRVFGFPKAHPAYFWIEDPAPRLLFSLGPAPLQTLQLLANPDMENQRLWPLITERAKAIDSARRSLGKAVGDVGDARPLGQLMEALAAQASAK